jgi:acyl-coenzyme A synthetase/AMP-(fatty) acid ligase
MAYSPFLGPYQPHSTVAWYHGKSISATMVLSHVSYMANQLPHKRYVLNMCQDRYAFLVGFAAALCHKQTTLLPPNPSPEILQQLTREYPDCYYLTDGREQIAGLEGVSINLDSSFNQTTMENPKFLDTHIAAIAFTSGTTGAPRPNLKSWESMVQIAQKTGERLSIAQDDPVTIVGTVPHQHMYGLETSIMLPLQRGWSIDAGRPFFPEDIASVLHEHQSQRILVSTPIHLRACVMAQSQFPEVAYTLSATAPLHKHLAKQVEELFQTTMVEIYGFAEAGTIATRQPMHENSWTLLPELTLVGHNDGYAVSSPYFSEPVPIPDTIQSANPQQFTLEGRPSHLINIGGHRASLDALNVQLLSIDGVIDGAFFMPEEKEESVTRLVAFVVAPGKTSASILSALRTKISPVFLPRPVYLIDSLPRNPTGKFVRKDAETLMRVQPNLARSPNHSINQ